jgi:hypothetical protein
MWEGAYCLSLSGSDGRVFSLYSIGSASAVFFRAVRVGLLWLDEHMNEILVRVVGFDMCGFDMLVCTLLVW